MTSRTRRPPARGRPVPKKSNLVPVLVPIVVALIGLAGVVITALLSCDRCEIKGRDEAIAELQPTIEFLETLAASSQTGQVTAAPADAVSGALGRIEGVFTDRDGSPISNLSVGFQNGPETITDISGVFVLDNVPAGDQLLVASPPSGKGDVTQHVQIFEDQTTFANIVYDAEASALGLLSITAPVDSGLLEVHKNDDQFFATIYGRCDGLVQILGNYDIWVLISAEQDGVYWLQSPPALIDANNNTWRANIKLGSQEYPPNDGERWDIVAVAAVADSEMGRVLNTPKLSLLPPHISSNVVSVELQLAP
jgi:hypothetical protein